MLPFRSGWLASTPVSMTPTSTFGLPPGDLVGVRSLDAPCVPLQRRERIALEHGRVGQPAAVPVPAPAGRGRDDASDGGDAFHVAVSVELRRKARVLGLRDDDVDLRVRGDDRAAGLLDVGARAPDVPAPLRVQDDVPLSRRLPRRSERDRRNDRKHDKSSGYTWPQVISPCWNLNPMDAEAPLQTGLYGHSARLHSLGRGRLPVSGLDPPMGGASDARAVDRRGARRKRPARPVEGAGPQARRPVRAGAGAHRLHGGARPAPHPAQPEVARRPSGRPPRRCASRGRVGFCRSPIRAPGDDPLRPEERTFSTIIDCFRDAHVPGEAAAAQAGPAEL